MSDVIETIRSSSSGTVGRASNAARGVRLVQELRAEMKLTVVMITHDVDTLFAVADRVAVLADKRLIALGTLAQVVPLQHPFIRNFFLGHTGRCAEENLRSYRVELSTASLLEQEM